jgi:serine protease
MDNNAAPGYYQGHGMGCAGLIAAFHCTDSTRGGCDSTGIISMAPVSLVMPIKIFPDEPDDTTQHGILLSNLCAAIDSAWKWGADVLSNSWSCADPYQAPIPSLEMALGRAYTQGRHGRGCPVVFAAGNFGDHYPDVVSYPARIDTCFAVGASTLGDTLWDYSCYGLDLDITAPSGYICFGGDVFSLDQMGWFGYNWGGGYDTSMCNGPDLWERCEDVDYNCYHGGTSAACPLVAGAAALLIARDTTLTAPQIYRILDSSSVPVVPFPRRDTLKYDWGRLDAFRALLAITRGDANNDGQKNVGDATYIINYVWRGGPPPKPHLLTGDANCDGETTNADAVYMVNYVFHGGPAPKICFDYGS